MKKLKSQVQSAIIERLVIGTDHPARFIVELERLCQQFASVADATNGDGYTFTFKVES